MPSLSRSNKAQFFILSAFAIVAVVYLISSWMEPYSIPDTSEIVLMEEPFVFNNIVEKAKETVSISKSCEELAFNLEEYKNFVKDHASIKNFLLDFSYSIDICDASGASVSFDIGMVSRSSMINSSFTATSGAMIPPPPPPPPGWWNSNWQNRKQLTFDNSGQPQGLNNFPVLVKLTTSNFDYSKAKADGTDLRFIDSDGSTQLKYHIEDWDNSGESFIWVKVPNIPAGSSADYIHMYYNNPAAVDVQDESNTYDSNFVMVHHFEESSGTIYDSTANNNDGTNHGATYLPVSKIDGAYYFVRQQQDYIEVPNSPSLQLGGESYTLEAWIKPRILPGSSSIISKLTGSTNKEYTLGLESDYSVTVEMEVGGNNYWYSVPSGIQPENWYYVTATFYQPTRELRIYVDSSLIGSDTVPANTLKRTDPLQIGRWDGTYGSTDHWNGTIDEVRISNTNRSPSWISASYLTMQDTLINYGPEEP